MLQYLNQDVFATTVQQEEIVLVDFSADWCGPCQMLQPILEEVAEEFDGKATIAKVDVDQNPALNAVFNIRSVPTLLFFKKGELVKNLQGVQSKKLLREELENLLSNQEVA